MKPGKTSTSLLLAQNDHTLKTIIALRFYVLIYMYGHFACMRVCVSQAHLVPSDPIGLGLQMVVGCHVHSGN